MHDYILRVDNSIVLELLPAAEYAVEAGILTEEEAAQTLAGFLMVTATPNEEIK